MCMHGASEKRRPESIDQFESSMQLCVLGGHLENIDLKSWSVYKMEGRFIHGLPKDLGLAQKLRGPLTCVSESPLSEIKRSRYERPD